MQVCAGFEAYHDGVDEHRQLHKLFKNELDALKWAEEIDPQDYVFRFYQPIELK